MEAYLAWVDLLKLSLEDAKLLFPQDPVGAVKDTVGAGDSFTAGLLALLLQKGYGKGSLARLSREDLRAILEGSIALSALACTVRGAYLPEEGLGAWRARYLWD